MATGLKTVEYWFPHLTTAADATDTPFTDITVTLPENSKVFRKVILDIWYHDANTTRTGTNNRRQVSLQLAALGYSPVNNTNVYTLSGENFCAAASGDFTSYFTTNWTGTSMTCTVSFLYDMSTTTPLGARNLSARLRITYEYDDTTVTQVKTVYIPLNAPVNALATTKPGSPTATIPALDTELPEASKSILQTNIVVTGNMGNTAATDNSISWEIDTLGVFTSQLYEQGGVQAMFYRLTNVVSFTTNASHSWYLWGSLATGNHQMAYMTVTYTFNASTSTTIFNSLILPMEFDSPMGGITAADYQRAARELWIEEPATITTKQIAYFMHFESATAVGGLNARVGTGSFVAYTDAAAVVAGGNALMIRNDAAFVLARGLNTLQADVYRTDTADLGWNLCGFWMINYTSGKATGGVARHNHTVFWNLLPYGTSNTALAHTVAATAPAIPEAAYFLNAVGSVCEYITNTTRNAGGVAVQVERLSAEGGVAWESLYLDASHTDPETGIRTTWSQARQIFKRWPGDPASGRVDIETNRRWRVSMANNATSFVHLDLIFTYHSITYSVAGNITGSAGGTVNIDVIRTSDNTRVLSTSRAGNGAWSATWYDNTVNLYATAREDATHIGRSDDGVAA